MCFAPNRRCQQKQMLNSGDDGLTRTGYYPGQLIWCQQIQALLRRIIAPRDKEQKSTSREVLKIRRMQSGRG